MKINDQRFDKRNITFSDVVPGTVYLDPMGTYVLATDEEILVGLLDGVVWRYGDYDEESVFTEVDGTLEIS